MKQGTVDEAAKEILTHQKITFLTGAGVSTPSGVPDYRSLTGIYHGMEQPEYLLSHQAMVNEPDKFYQFVKKIYHPEAKPNIIHLEMAHLAKAKSPQLVNFHGSLYQCHCRKCKQTVDWKEYLHSDKHQACGGQIRPNIVLYGEGFQDEVIEQAAYAVSQAELVVIVGTSFQVHPFCDLVQFRQPSAKILVINQTPVYLAEPYTFIQEDGAVVFKKIQELGVDYD